MTGVQTCALPIWEAWKRCIASEDEAVLYFVRSAWSKEPLALQRRLARLAFEQLCTDSSRLDFAAVDDLLAWLDSAGLNTSLSWIAGIQVLVEGDQLIFQMGQKAKIQGPQMGEPLAIAWNQTGQFRVNAAWSLMVESSLESGIQGTSTGDANSILCDLSAFKVLKLRPRKAGDRFQPLGMREGSMKLSDYMINVKLPERARAAWPVLAAGSQILWVPGFQLADRIRVRPESKELVRLSLRRVGN